MVSDSLWQWNSPGQNTRVGSPSLLQRIFPTQESNPGLPHCRQILYQLSHQGGPYLMKMIMLIKILKKLLWKLSQVMKVEGLAFKNIFKRINSFSSWWSSVLKPVCTTSCVQLFYISYQLCVHQVGSLKYTTVRVFMPQKLAKAMPRIFFSGNTILKLLPVYHWLTF